MNRMFLKIFLVLSFNVAAQNFQLKIIDPILCIDYERNQLIVIDDSAYQIQISLTDKKAIRKPLFWDGNLTFKELRSEFVPISEKGSPIYFVDRGCGWVCILKNDSIVRVDRSFHHQNQFGGTFFVHHGTPHIFGGYGLFTYKNFITKYDKNLKQWYLENEGARFLYRENMIFSKTKDFFHVLLPKKQTDKIPKEFWTYNLIKKNWKYIGEIQGIDSIRNNSIIAFKDNFIVGFNNAYEFDFNSMRMKFFRIEPINTVLRVIKGPNSYILLSQVYEADQNKKSSSIVIYDKSDFRDKFLISSNLIHIKEKSSKNYLLTGLFIGLVSLTLLWLWYKRNQLKKKHIIISVTISELLELWLSRTDYLLELSELNDLVNHDEPSADTIKKRRENLLRQFSEEIALFYGVKINQVYYSEAHPTDKRMKRLRLSTVLVDKIKKGK